MARAGLTPERPTRAGAELADEAGFDQVTVSALAGRFDIKVASLYSHVTSSQNLKTRIALVALEELADRVAAALAGRAGEDALVAFADARCDYAREHPGRYDAARLGLDPETAAASAGVRHARMTRAIPARLRPVGAGPDARGPDAGQRLPRLRQPGDGRRIQPHRRRLAGVLAMDPGRPRRPARNRSTP